jgi:DNA-binding transcriptional regulator GbsR (MarR family)
MEARMTEATPTASPDELVEQFGAFFEVFGIKRNVGRIWSTLFLASLPLSQTELSRRTGLSAGMVSESLRELDHWGAVRVVPAPGERSSRYEAEESLLSIVATILRKRELEAVRNLREAIRKRRAEGARFDNERISRRLAAVEEATELYEALTAMIGRLARLSGTSVTTATKVVNRMRFLERSARALRGNR